MVRFSFCGAEFVALPQGALYWPARGALLVADLHLEKASWFATLGQMLPPYDSLATLSDLSAILAATGAGEVWCLGDSFHDARAGERMSRRTRDMLSGLTGDVRWTWITGNHDRTYAERFGGETRDEAEIDGLVLRHEAVPGEARPELSGHFHPKLRVTLRGRQVARRCFIASGCKLILPAFGALTGGLDANDPAIVRAVGAPATALVPLAGRLLRFPLAA